MRISDIVNVNETVQKDLAKDLLAGKATSVKKETSVGIIGAVKLSEENFKNGSMTFDLTTNTDDGDVEDDEDDDKTKPKVVGVKVKAPLDLLTRLQAVENSSGSNEQATLTVTAMDKDVTLDVTETLGEKGQQLAAPIVSVSAILSGQELDIQSLAEPILLTIPVPDPTDPTLTCQYWNKATSKWSTAEVWHVASTDDEFVCATRHLSVFGAFSTSSTSSTTRASTSTYEQLIDEFTDSDYISGATADLDSAGYSAIATLCCPTEMAMFAERVINHIGFVVCNKGSLAGLVAWYHCHNQTRSFAELVEEITAAASGDCAWVGTESQCPTMSNNCPHFPDILSHRRRNCLHRKALRNATTSTAPSPENVVACNRENAVSLDFSSSAVSVNNLGGRGPSEGAEEIRFQNIGVASGRSFDLVVQATTAYEPANTDDNGLVAALGRISLQSGHSVGLRFSLQDTTTNAAVTLPEFYFTLLDIDQESMHIRERIYVSSLAHYAVMEVNDIEIEEMADGRMLFKSMLAGHDWDDPTDPSNLAVVTSSDLSDMVDQRKRAAMIVFRDISQFEISFEVTQSGVDPSGRNFLFGGQSNLINYCV